MKPKGKIKPNVRLAGKAERKTAIPSRRIWAIGGLISLIIVITWLLFSPARRGAPPPPSPAGARGTGGTLNPQSAAPSASPGSEIQETERTFIQAIRMEPARPTRIDILKASVEVAPDAPQKLDYTYQWKVNDRIVEEDASGDTLNLSPFKKGDLITVTVTPYDGGTAGFSVESPVIAIHSIPPSLELKAMKTARKAGEPIELQLIGNAPDGELVAFSLEAPHVPGMTIDKRSGKISWLLQPGQKGLIRFGAAVEDDNGTKITKIFDITAE